MDLLTQIRLTRELVDIDSTTGREGEAGAWLAACLRALGYQVIEQPVTDGRFNVLATLGEGPRVTFSTHFDCVPPFFPSREENGRIHGRGSCDAKGTAVAQIAAAERLRAAGERRLALLFVVGEERGSDGAKLANNIAQGAKYLINGEPTDNRLARATRGIYRVRLRSYGRAAHSSQPELGASAIEKLIDALVALRRIDWPHDSELGVTYYTVGMISGGVAPNVIPAKAQAEVMLRTVGHHVPLRDLIVEAVGDDAELEEVLVVPPVALKTLAGLETAVFNFTTDIPFLTNWGTPLLVGPGSVTLAHTADEYVSVAELQAAVDLYVDLATRLLADV
ncbi:MAG: M20/M25/M40 family metallo-hydrolase [Vicinamibacterales bacterium]